MTLKRTQIILLPTEQKADLQLWGKWLFHDKNQELSNRKPKAVYQNLYFVSDDKIKEGDWIYIKNRANNEFIDKVSKVTNEGVWTKDDHYFYPYKLDKDTICKKIIATTDEALCHCNPDYDPRSKTGREFIYLPEPSEDFIKEFITEFNKGNRIEYVEVEYDNRCCGRCDGVHDLCFTDTECDKHGVEGCETCFGKAGNILKVNSKNEISIKKIKDTYTRDEVITLIKEFDNSTRTVREKEIQFRNKWIEDNL